MFSGSEIVEVLREMEATHVVALPDSTLGLWEDAIFARPVRRNSCGSAARAKRGRSRQGSTWAAPVPS